MASLWITVFEAAMETAHGDVLQAMTPVTIGAGSLQSEVVIAGSSARKRRTVRLFADTDCHVAWGADPTATTNDFPMGAENPEYINAEALHKIAVIERV